MSTAYDTPLIFPDDSPRARRTDPSNGTRGRKRIDPMTRYVVAENGCWLWQGFVGANGYGQCWTGSAHRHFYRKLVGPIPEGMQVDHLCHIPGECTAGSACLHRRCVNPAHLLAVTPRENVLRSNSFVAKNAMLTHCPAGHEYAGENVIQNRGQRVCRACLERTWRRQHAKERTRVADRSALKPAEHAVLFALNAPHTDAEVASLVCLTRQTVVVARGALSRAGLVKPIGTKPTRPGVRPAIVWSAA